jgi:hypothetical protein
MSTNFAKEFKLFEMLFEGHKANTKTAIAPNKTKSKLTEASSRQMYRAFMEVQDYIANMTGWTIIDCQQDSNDTMLLKCKLANGVYVWYELSNGEYEHTEEVEDLLDYAQECQVSVDIEDSDRDTYDIRVYLSYYDA